MARWLKTDLIVCAQKVSNKEWEVMYLSSFSTSSSMSIATEDGRNTFKEEVSCLVSVVYDATSSSTRKRRKVVAARAEAAAARTGYIGCPRSTGLIWLQHSRMQGIRSCQKTTTHDLET